MTVRAGVRAHVSAATGDAEAARRYLAVAEDFLSPPKAKLTAIGGLSGAGKSVEARRWAALSPPGAAILSTDLVRKRLWSARPLDALPDAAYAPAEDDRVHDELFNAAGRALAAGWPVILDATFLDPENRAAAEAVATRAGVPFEGLWLEADADVLRARVAARTDDPSEADLRVLERQLVRDVGEVTWRRSSN
jgi:hypothetical protein